MTRRFNELRYKIAGKLEIVYYKYFTYHVYLESCVHALLDRSEVDEYGMSEIYLVDLIHNGYFV